MLSRSPRAPLLSGSVCVTLTLLIDLLAGKHHCVSPCRSIATSDLIKSLTIRPRYLIACQSTLLSPVNHLCHLAACQSPSPLDGWSDLMSIASPTDRLSIILPSDRLSITLLFGRYFTCGCNSPRACRTPDLSDRPRTSAAPERLTISRFYYNTHVDR